jgi:hypothetical protein
VKRALIILVFGLVLAVCGYCALYYGKTAGTLAIQASAAPELAWLKEEFSLSDTEFQRICKLHEAYLPRCAEMCAAIGKANSELQALVVATNQVTPEIEANLAKIGKLRQECQRMMLHHFYSVSQSMPAEQGRRYLAEMQRLTSLSNMRDHSVTVHSEHDH